MSEHKLFEVINPRGRQPELNTPTGWRYWFFEVDAPDADVIEKLEAETRFTLGEYPTAIQRDDSFVDALPAGYDDFDAAQDAIKAGYCCVQLPDFLDTEDNAGLGRCADGNIPSRFYACRPK